MRIFLGVILFIFLTPTFASQTLLNCVIGDPKENIRMNITIDEASKQVRHQYTDTNNSGVSDGKFSDTKVSFTDQKLLSNNQVMSFQKFTINRSDLGIHRYTHVKSVPGSENFPIDFETEDSGQCQQIRNAEASGQ